MSTNYNSPITVNTPVNVYPSINFLPPYLQKQPLMQDLCFFIDYLQVDIEAAYNDLRYKYIDWSKISEEGAVQTLSGMGMDYIIDLIRVIKPSNSTQLLALCSIIWLLKGQLLGVDIIASICGFTYEYTVWHEKVPLGKPNTATINIDFVKYRQLSQDFQHNFVEFLRKYLYPVVDAHVDVPPMVDELAVYGVQTWQSRYHFVEIGRYHGEPIEYSLMPILLNERSPKVGCSLLPDNQGITTNIIQKWTYPVQFGTITGYLDSSPMKIGSLVYTNTGLTLNSLYGEIIDLTEDNVTIKYGDSIRYSGSYEILAGNWEQQGYYAVSGYWGAKAVSGAYCTEYLIHDTGKLYIYKINISANFDSGSPEQTINTYISYSDDGENYSNWKLVNDGDLIAFRYCIFRVEFNSTIGTQMSLYSYDITLS